MDDFRNKNKPREHDWLHVSFLLTNVIIYVVMVIITNLAFQSIFPSNVPDPSTVYPIDIQPADWVFSIVWTIIFIWNFVWLVYAFACLFRRASDGSILYRKYDFFHFSIFVVFIFQNLFIVGWIFLWTYKYLGWSLLFIILTLLPLYVCLFISHRKLYKLKHDLIIDNLKRDLVLVRILCQNGLGFFATWLSIATNVNLTYFLGYACSVDVSTSGTIALFIILVLVVTYSVLENIVWPRYLLYMFTPWFVLNIALVGLITQNWKTTPTRNNIIGDVYLVSNKVEESFGKERKIVNETTEPEKMPNLE